MLLEVEKPVILYEESVKKYTYPDLKQQGGNVHQDLLSQPCLNISKNRIPILEALLLKR
jgi:hypothetical protein